MADELNFYLVLGLRVNPPEEDERVIQNTIAHKQAEWSEMLRGKDQNYAQNLLDKLPEIKNVMLNPSARREEAKRGAAIQGRVLDQCINTLKMIGRNKRPDATAFSKMAAKNAQYGITQAMLEKAYDQAVKQGGGGEDAKQEQFEMPDLSVRKTIKRHLEILGLSNLYEFLECSPSDSCQILMAKAEKIYTQMVQQPNKTAKVSASQELAGTCKMQFKDEASKKKYDNLMRYNQFPDVQEQLLSVGKNNDKTIDTASFKQILAYACDTHHISVGEATAYIELCCRINKFDLGDNVKVKCAACGAENSSKATQCVKCGRPLHIYCPKCGTDNNNVATTCAKCRFSLADMGKALPLIAKAREAIKMHQLQAAGQAISSAAEYWPGHPDLEQVSEKYEELVSQEKDTVGAIKRAIENLQICKARDLLGQARNLGVTVPSDYSSLIKSILEDVQRALNEAHGQDPDTAFETLLKARSHIVDYAELNAMMGNYPPAPPASIQARQVSHRAEISWTASVSRGKVTYEIVRKENTPSSSVKDGISVASGEALNCIDSTIEAGREYYYTVYALREGVYSVSGTYSNPIARTPAISGLQYVPGDSQCTVSWTAPASVIGVRVMRQAPGTGIAEVQGVRLQGFTDRGLTNGVNYTYTISAQHRINGNVYEGEPVSIQAIPVPEAKPVTDLNVTSDGQMLTASWTQDAFSEIVLMAARNMVPSCGDSLPAEQVRAQFDSIAVTSQSQGNARFTLNGVNEATIIPFAVQGTYYIAGEPFHLINIPRPRGLTADVLQGSVVCLNLSDWPRGVKMLRILYRQDTYPESVDDPLANGINCTKDKYENDAGVLMSGLAYGSYYICVYSEERSRKGEKLYSEPAKTEVSLMPVQDIVYSLNYKKGFLGRRGTLTLVIQTKAPSIPRFILVQKAGTPPLNRASGEAIYATDGPVEIPDGRLEIPIPWQSPDRNRHYVKMFFAAEKEYSAYTLRTNTPNLIE